MGPWRESNLIKEKGGGEGRGTADRHGKHREEREKRRGRGRREWGLLAPLVHDVVLAITPFICNFSPFISERPPPRGCRHCWPNHVKYCVYCRVFSLSNLCLIGLSHSIRLLSCPISLLRGCICILLLSEFFWRYTMYELKFLENGRELASCLIFISFQWKKKRWYNSLVMWIKVNIFPNMNQV